jgi:aminoglycoside phosphotransferase (APT) family kinase protein
MHPGQLSVSPITVRTLLAEQFPQWQHLRIQGVPSPGTVNAIFRIGDQFVARFPLIPDDDVAAVRERLQREAAAAEELIGRTPFATPRPIAVGEPGVGYPLSWSVNTWLPGKPATADDCSESNSFAIDLGEFINAVRDRDLITPSLQTRDAGRLVKRHCQEPAPTARQQTLCRDVAQSRSDRSTRLMPCASP